jgi:hypothetical protein
MALLAVLQGKGNSGFSYSGIDEILVSHGPVTDKCHQFTLITQIHLINLYAAENGFLLHL